MTKRDRERVLDRLIRIQQTLDALEKGTRLRPLHPEHVGRWTRRDLVRAFHDLEDELSASWRLSWTVSHAVADLLHAEQDRLKGEPDA